MISIGHVTTPHRVGAQATEPWELQLQAPPDCPTQAVLLANIRHDLRHRNAFTQRYAIEIAVAQSSDTVWKARLRIRSIVNRNTLDDATADTSDAGGPSSDNALRAASERELSAQSCEALFSVTGLVIATLFDPESDPTPELAPADARARTAPQATNSAPDATASNTAETGTERATAPGATPQAPTPRRVGSSTAPQQRSVTPTVAAPPQTKTNGPELSAGDQAHSEPKVRSDRSIWIGPWGAFDSGSLESGALAFGAGLGFDWGRYRVQGVMGWWLAKSLTVTTADDIAASGKFSMTAGAVKGCFDVWQKDSGHVWVTVAPCGGLEVERWSGQGTTQAAVTEASQLWGLGLSGGGLGRLAIGKSIALSTNLDLLWLVNPPQFGYYDSGAIVKVFRPDSLVIRIGAGVEAHFW